MTLSAPLQEFVRTVHTLLDRELPLPALFEHVTPEFHRVLAEPDLLSPEQRAPGEAAFTQRLLYRDATARFSLVALIWQPCAATPVHDHRAWGLAGVYRGCERETRFKWQDHPGGGPGLCAFEERLVHPGEVLPIVPPDDVHRVANPGPLPTISIHLYGLDVETVPDGSSVRRVYSSSLILPTAAKPVALAS